jgi:hypothetical protein
MPYLDRRDQRRYAQKWYYANRNRIAAEYAAKRDWLAALKLERGCEWVLEDGSVCGYREHPVALEFDHRDPSEKRFTISNRVACDRSVLLEEIAKCDVLCSNHHQIRTATDGHFRLRREPSEPIPQLSLFEEAS